MEFKQLQARVFELIRSRHLLEAEEFLLHTKPLFKGQASGKWFHLYAQTGCRVRPEDREGFFTACISALRLLQGNHEALCSLYITLVSQAIVWRDWRQARVGIRRLRAMARRHPTEYGIQQMQGMVLLNEALVERIAGDFVRAVSLVLLGIEAMERYAYSPLMKA